MADNGLQTRTLVAALKSAIKGAWGVPIYLRRQDLPQAANAGYAILLWLPVAISFSGPGGAVSSPSQRNRFKILGRFLYPTDPSVQVDVLKAANRAGLRRHRHPAACHRGGPSGPGAAAGGGVRFVGHF